MCPNIDNEIVYKVSHHVYELCTHTHGDKKGLKNVQQLNILLHKVDDCNLELFS